MGMTDIIGRGEGDGSILKISEIKAKSSVESYFSNLATEAIWKRAKFG